MTRAQHDQLYAACSSFLEDEDVEERTDKVEKYVREQDELLDDRQVEEIVLRILRRNQDERKATASLTTTAAPVATTRRGLMHDPAVMRVIKSTAPAAYHLSRARPKPTPTQTAATTAVMAEDSSTPTPDSPSLASSSPSSSSLPKNYFIKSLKDVGSLPTFTPRSALLRSSPAVASPFSSPRNSPRPFSPNSPNLNLDNLVSTAPSPSLADLMLSPEDDTSFPYPDYLSHQPDYQSYHAQQNEYAMGPHDTLRSILGENYSNNDLERILEENSYDLTATLQTLQDERTAPVDVDVDHEQDRDEARRHILIGKSLSPGPNNTYPRSPTPSSRAIPACRYLLAGGHCARADCKYNHDLSSTICKHWLAGSCLAGDNCIFLHPRASTASAPPPQQQQQQQTKKPSQKLNMQDLDAFPSLFSAAASSAPKFAPLSYAAASSSSPSSRPQSRRSKSSTHKHADIDIFPALGGTTTATFKTNKSKRFGAGRSGSSGGGPGHGRKDSPHHHHLTGTSSHSGPSIPVPGSPLLHAGRSRTKESSQLSSAAAESPPWSSANSGGNSNSKPYLDHRKTAVEHATLRSQSGGGGDSRPAKSHSLKGREQNILGTEGYRAAAVLLYD